MTEDIRFEKEELQTGLIRYRMPGGVYTYLVKGNEKAVLIDTGYGLGSFKEEVETELCGLPYQVVLTHGHVDHAGASAEFEKVWLHDGDLELVKRHTVKEFRAAFMRRDSIEDMVEQRQEPYLSLQYGQLFDLGDEILEIVCLGGHTPGSVGILFRRRRILLAGDACCSVTLLFGKGESLSIREYHDNLVKTWEGYRDAFDDMLYSHPHNYGGPEVMTQMIELCEEILAGKDDHLESQDMMGKKTYMAKAMNGHGRLDGKIANLLYAADCL